MSRRIGYPYKKITVATAGKPVQLSTEKLRVPWVEVYVYVSNSGSVYLSTQSAIFNASAGDGGAIPRTAGELFTITPSESSDFNKGDYLDLSDWYVDADTAADYIIIQYPEPLAGV